MIDHSFVCTVKLAHPTANVLRALCVSFLLTQEKACCCHSEAPPTSSCLCRFRASYKSTTQTPESKLDPAEFFSSLLFILTPIPYSLVSLDSCITATGCRREQHLHDLLRFSTRPPQRRNNHRLFPDESKNLESKSTLPILPATCLLTQYASWQTRPGQKFRVLDVGPASYTFRRSIAASTRGRSSWVNDQDIKILATFRLSVLDGGSIEPHKNQHLQSFPYAQQKLTALPSVENSWGCVLSS